MICQRSFKWRIKLGTTKTINLVVSKDLNDWSEVMDKGSFGCPGNNMFPLYL